MAARSAGWRACLADSALGAQARSTHSHGALGRSLAAPGSCGLGMRQPHCRQSRTPAAADY
eukprot:2020382-Alexandrium_andersonii.AAC.1